MPDDTIIGFTLGVTLTVIAAFIRERATTKGARRDKAARASAETVNDLARQFKLTAEQLVVLRSQLYEHFFQTLLKVEKDQKPPDLSKNLNNYLNNLTEIDETQS